MAVPALESAMFFIGLGTAAPATRYEQRESWDALRHSASFTQLAPRSHAILKKVLCGNNGIDSRHLALAPLTEVFDQTPDALQARFTRHAPALATEAAKRALADANCQPSEMDAVLVSTCTDYSILLLLALKRNGGDTARARRDLGLVIFLCCTSAAAACTTAVTISGRRLKRRVREREREKEREERNGERERLGKGGREREKGGSA